MNLREDVERAINRNSAEEGSNTPDYVLAEFLLSCLRAFDAAVVERERWNGRGPGDDASDPPIEPPPFHVDYAVGWGEAEPTMACVRYLIAQMRFANYPCCTDGTHHVVLRMEGARKILLKDPEFRRLNQAIPHHVYGHEHAFGYLLGTAFYDLDAPVREGETRFPCGASPSAGELQAVYVEAMKPTGAIRPSKAVSEEDGA